MNKLSDQKCDLVNVLSRKVMTFVRPAFPIYELGYYYSRHEFDSEGDFEMVTDYMIRLVKVKSDIVPYNAYDMTWFEEFQDTGFITEGKLQDMQETLPKRGSLLIKDGTLSFISIERVA